MDDQELIHKELAAIATKAHSEMIDFLAENNVDPNIGMNRILYIKMSQIASLIAQSGCVDEEIPEQLLEVHKETLNICTKMRNNEKTTH